MEEQTSSIAYQNLNQPTTPVQKSKFNFSFLKNKKVLFVVSLILIALVPSVVFTLITSRLPFTKPKPQTYIPLQQVEGKLVENFPDVPQYPQADVLKSVHYTEENGVGFSVDYRTSDSILDVTNWYKEQVVEQDWELKYQTGFETIPASFLLEFEKEDVLLSITTIEQENDRVGIFLTHHQGMGETGRYGEDK